MPGQRLGQGQQPQRLGGGCAVDDDEVPTARLRPAAQLQQSRDLLRAGQRRQLLRDDRIDAYGVEDLQQVVLYDAPLATDPCLGAHL